MRPWAAENTTDWGREHTKNGSFLRRSVGYGRSQTRGLKLFTLDYPVVARDDGARDLLESPGQCAKSIHTVWAAP